MYMLHLSKQIKKLKVDSSAFDVLVIRLKYNFRAKLAKTLRAYAYKNSSLSFRIKL